MELVAKSHIPPNAKSPIYGTSRFFQKFANRCATRLSRLLEVIFNI